MSESAEATQHSASAGPNRVGVPKLLGDELPRARGRRVEVPVSHQILATARHGRGSRSILRQRSVGGLSRCGRGHQIMTTYLNLIATAQAQPLQTDADGTIRFSFTGQPGLYQFSVVADARDFNWEELYTVLNNWHGLNNERTGPW